MKINHYNSEQLDEHIAQCIELMRYKTYNKNRPESWLDWLSHIINSLQTEQDHINDLKNKVNK